MSNQIQVLKQSIQAMAPQFKAALPSHISPEKFVRVVQTALGQNPELANLDRNSLFAACVKAAQDGLLPDGKEAALVKFGGQVQYLPMVNGLLKKIRNSGELATITSHVIYKHDEFKFWVDGDGEHIEHRPLFFGERGPAVGVYALAKTKDGATYYEIMTMEQIKAVENSSRSKNGPWSGPFRDEMLRKTAIRRLSKRLPMSTDLETVVERDDEMYDITPAKIEPEPKIVEKKSKRLSKLVEQTESEIVPEAPVETNADEDVI